MTSASYEGGIRMPEPLRGRPGYIPDWSPVFTDEDLSREVRSRGEGLGFTVRQVLPERRWAIEPATGELIPQPEFDQKYRQWKSFYFDENREFKAVQKANRYFQSELIPVPNVRRFVDAKIGPDGRFYPIAFDPDKPAPKVDRPKLYTANGDEAPAGAAMKGAGAVLAQVQLIEKMRADGVLSEEQAAEQRAALFGGTSEPAPEPEGPPAGFAPAEEAEEVIESALRARCGVTCKSPAGRAAHERNCPKCQPREAA